MNFIKHKHHVPGLNTTSTADISFMLLIFFLVTTNMDVDKGLSRQLPPADKQEQEDSYVAKGTLMTLKITADNRLWVDDRQVPVDQLRGMVEQFVTRVGKRHLIKIDVDPQASYDAYFHVQNALVAAYNHLRQLAARRLYGRDYAKLSPEQRDAVKDQCPQRIAENMNVGQVAASAGTSNEGGE